MLPFPLSQLLSHVLLFCNPIDHSPPGSSVCGISQARILEWIAISFSSGSSWPQDQTCIYCIAGGFFTTKSPTHSSVLAWKIPGTAEPGGLPPVGLQRVRHDWSNLAAAAPGLSTCMCPNSVRVLVMVISQHTWEVITTHFSSSWVLDIVWPKSDPVPEPHPKGPAF